MIFDSSLLYLFSNHKYTFCIRERRGVQVEEVDGLNPLNVSFL